jgi:hypothetical protein
VPPRIFLGTPHENPVLLTRQDWRGPRATWRPGGLGYWDVQVETEGAYEIKLRFDAQKADTQAVLSCCGTSATLPVKTGATECVFPTFRLTTGAARLEVHLGQDATAVGVNYVEVKRVN